MATLFGIFGFILLILAIFVIGVFVFIIVQLRRGLHSFTNLFKGKNNRYHGDENTQSVHQGTYTSKTTDRPKGKIIPDDEGEYVDFYEEK